MRGDSPSSRAAPRAATADEPPALQKLVQTAKALACGMIVVVDDSVPDIEHLRARLSDSETPPKIWTEISGGVEWPDDHDERWAAIQKAVDSLEFEKRRQVTTRLYGEFGWTANWDSLLTEALHDLTTEIKDFVVLSVGPREWEEHRPSLKAGEKTATAFSLNGRMIVLFDYNLSSIQGRHDGEGLELAKGFVMEAGASAYCAVVSQGFETQAAREAIRGNLKAIERDRLDLIPKSDLKSPKALASRLVGIHRAHAAAELRRIAVGAFKGAHEQTAVELDDIEVVPLLHVVFDRTLGEGVPEFDTMRRMYQIHWVGALDRVDLERAPFDAIVQELRSLSELDHPKPPFPKQAVELEYRERYQETEIVNRRHRTVGLGDVFELESPAGGASQRFVLVMQACDLAIRGNGTRQIPVATLLQLSPSDPKTHGFCLKYLGTANDKGQREPLYVRFRPPTFVPFEVLDCCVFSGNGEAVFKPGSPPPINVPQGTLALHAALDKHCKRVLEAAATDRDRASLVAAPGATSSVIGRVAEGEVSYRCKRVLRIRNHEAMRLLLEYTQYAGRLPEEMDMVGNR
jgi:hypothetical protein